MISTNEFRTNSTIEFENNIYQVIEFQHVKSARSGAFVRTKLKNLRTGAIFEHTFSSGDKVKRAQINKVAMQYLYASGTEHVFMNTETYDQINLQEEQIKEELKYIPEGVTVDIIFYENSEVLGIELKDKVVLEVTETEPGVKGDTKTNAMKDAVLETGLLVKVPLFIEQGEKIIVSTQDATYVSREK